MSPSCNVFCDSFFIIDPSFFSKAIRLRQSLTSLLIHDGLLMVARLFGMCLLLASLTLLLEFQILNRHYSDNGLFKGLVIKFSLHCIEICFSKVLVFFWYYISVFIENVIAWSSAILSVIFRFTISSSSVDKTRLNVQYCSTWCTCCVRLLSASNCYSLLRLRDGLSWVTDVTTLQSDWTGLLFFCTSFHIHSPLLTLFLCFIVLFQSCCSHAQVFGKTLMHEFPIFYSHTEWNLFSSVTNTLLWWRACYQKLNYKQNQFVDRCGSWSLQCPIYV